MEPELLNFEVPSFLLLMGESEKVRTGKWTTEEQNYLDKIVEDFEKGLLPISRGTSLRLLLSKVLNCDPMRLTKKCARNNKAAL